MRTWIRGAIAAVLAIAGIAAAAAAPAQAATRTGITHTATPRTVQPNDWTWNQHSG